MNSSPFILMSGPYAEPRPEAANRLLAAQARAVVARGLRVEVLTNAMDGVWRGPVPGADAPLLGGLPHVRHVSDGIVHHVVRVPRSWHERTPPDRVWRQAIQWATACLDALRPDVVHQHYWQTLLCVPEAARRLGIPYGYSFYDFGLGCLRTTLVTGRGELCAGPISADACGRCLRTGRGPAGWLNEWLVRLPPVRHVIDRFGLGPDRSGPLARFQAVSEAAEQRVRGTLDRARSVLGGAAFAVAPSPFAVSFMERLGLREGVGRVLPWFIDDGVRRDPPPGRGEGLRFGFLGRISPEKGLDVLLRAFRGATLAPSTTLTILGRLTTDYARDLRTESAGRDAGRIIWDEISDRATLMEAIRRVHVFVFPSVWMDNTPASLVESLAVGRPAIVTDIPTMTSLVEDGVNGLSFPMGDSSALARRLEACEHDPMLIERFAARLPPLLSVSDYAAELSGLYAAATSASPAFGPSSGAT